MKPAGHFTLSAVGSERQEALCSGDAREGSRRLSRITLSMDYRGTAEVLS